MEFIGVNLFLIFSYWWQIFKKLSDAAGNVSQSSPLDSYAAQDPGELIGLGEENAEIHDRFFPITINFYFFSFQIWAIDLQYCPSDRLTQIINQKCQIPQ